MVLSDLSAASIQKAIDERLDLLNNTEQKIKLRRSDDLETFHSLLSPTKSEQRLHTGTYLNDVHDVIPIYIILEKEEVGLDGMCICGASLFSLGYSTWKGRVMNLDLFIAENEQRGETMMRCLTEIAEVLDCARIVHQTQGHEEAQLFRETHGAEVLPDWLTLRMGKNEMETFIESRNNYGKPRLDDETEIPKGSPPNVSVQDAIDDSLTYMNFVLSHKNGNENIQLRRATGNDADAIFNLVEGLAIYEKAADQISVTPAIYRRDGGDIAYPIFYTILVESSSPEKSGVPSVVGMGFFYIGFSASNGKYLYLEDLFIREKNRGAGYGKSIMYSLANIALKLNCQNFIWQALDWNAPALTFYSKIGAKICENVVTVRFDDGMIKIMNSKK